MAWSPDSTSLISAGLDGTIRVYSEESGWSSRIMGSQAGGIHALAWARIGNSDRGAEESEAIISGGVDGTLRVWSAHPGFDVAFDEENWVAAAQWSPNGQIVASSAFTGRFHLLDLFSGQSVTIPTRAKAGVHDLAWSPSGDTVATAARDGKALELYTAVDGHFVGRFLMPEPLRVYWNPTGEMIVGCGHGGARCWEVKTARLVWDIPGVFGSVAWIAKGTQVAIGGADGSIKVFDASTGQPLRSLRLAQSELLGSLPSEFEPPQQVFDLATSPDDRFLAFGTQDGVAGLLDTRDGSQVQTFEGHISGIRQVAWRPDGSRLATVGEDGTVRVFNPENGRVVVDTNHGSGDNKLKSVAWDASGDRMLTGGWDNKMRLWDASRGYLIEEAEALTTRAEKSPADIKVWRALADKCTQLGWPDRAHEAFVRINALAGDNAATSAQVAEADWIFAHAIEGARLPSAPVGSRFHVPVEAAGLLRAIGDYVDINSMRAAVETWRQLAQNKDAEALLPLARMYFSKVKSWKVTWFACENDPVSDLAGWRAAAAKHPPIDQPMLCFPFQNRSPKALGLVSSESIDLPDTPIFNMIAICKRMLPAGKWRCAVKGGEGCRVIVGGRTVLEQWTGTMDPQPTADFDQASDVEVEIRVESFLRQPVEHFDFTLEPLL
ncbi:MAG: WD40 repeat domain-containing protein [Chthoniobacteraceae bacterium]